jgi:hypothetical protein
MDGIIVFRITELAQNLERMIQEPKYFPIKLENREFD